MKRYRLLQARFSEDPARIEELGSFAARLGIPTSQITTFDMLTEHIEMGTVIDGVDAVLVGGSGAFSVLDDAPWLRDFIDTLGAIADSGFPMFASCFGFQAMVLALGGEVATDEHGAEVGSYEVTLAPEASADPLFQRLPRAFVAQQGHKDRATRLPASVVNLASSQRCPFQAIRIPGRPIYATQFHPELSASDNRQRFERYFDMYSDAFGASQATRMLDEFMESPEANSLLAGFAELLDSTAWSRSG